MLHIGNADMIAGRRTLFTVHRNSIIQEQDLFAAGDDTPYEAAQQDERDRFRCAQSVS